MAVTFGVWTGLYPGGGPLVLGIAFAFLLLFLKSESWAVIFGMIALLAYLVEAGAGFPEIAIWAGNLLALAFTHRRELRKGVHFRLTRGPA